jgi:hypothetical protein
MDSIWHECYSLTKFGRIEIGLAQNRLSNIEDGLMCRYEYVICLCTIILSSKRANQDPSRRRCI